MEIQKTELLRAFDAYLITVSANKDIDRLTELQIMLEGRLIEIERRKKTNCIKCKADLTEEDYQYATETGTCLICQLNNELGLNPMTGASV